MTERAFWIILSGGICVAIGILGGGAFVLATSLGLGPQGFPPDFRGLQTISYGGQVLEALGFLLGFVGIAMALRAPSPAPTPRIGGKGFRAILVGGLLIVVGAGVSAIVGIAGILGYYLPGSGIYTLLDATMVMQALGFFIAFYGIALGFPPSW